MSSNLVTADRDGAPTTRRWFGILADEGVAGVRRRVFKTLRPTASQAAIAAARRDYEQRVRDFKATSSRLGYGDLSKYYWYHTIDLGNGVVTPGDYDYRSMLAEYGFPADMRGMKVLDVGSATGFFSFEFEKRGASVVSVDLPSIADWDMPHGEKQETLQSLMNAHGVTTVDELTHFHTHGPFEICRKALGSKVERCYSRIYDLSPEKLGHSSFDMIFVGDVLLHTFSPLAALVALAPLCKGELVLAQLLPDVSPYKPLMLFTGGARDRRTWWHPNKLALVQMLQRVGFQQVRQVGQHQSYPGAGRFFTKNHVILHATK